MRPLHPAPRSGDQSGFTLVEMVIAVALGAIVFTALAAYLNGGLRLLAVQKARTQGNEIATQAIEDLQRIDDESVGLCTAATTPPAVPAGFADPVILPNCAGAVLTHPCTTTVAPVAPADLVPSPQYTCSRLNITYTVRRYVAWNTGRTAKLLGVYVNWTDSGRAHEVFQQSTRGNPTASPAVVSASVTGATSILNTGALDGAAVVLTATTSGLSNPPAANDAVRASFTYRDTAGIPRPAIITLASTGTDTWGATINPGDFAFPRGTQFFIFSVFRAEDRRTAYGSAIERTFSCALCPALTAVTTPTVSGASVTATPTITSNTVDVDATGTLVSDPMVISATTSRVDPGAVYVVLPTTAGAQLLAMTAQPGCTSANCNWRATISRAVAGTKGYRFAGSTTGQDLRFLTTQTQTDGTTAVSVPNTLAAIFR